MQSRLLHPLRRCPQHTGDAVHDRDPGRQSSSLQRGVSHRPRLRRKARVRAITQSVHPGRSRVPELQTYIQR